MDWALVVVDPTQASDTLAWHMKNMGRRLHSGQSPATAHLDNDKLVILAERLFREAPLRGAVFVLNKITDSEVESYLTEQFATYGIEPIASIYQESSIGEAWLRGIQISGSLQTGLGSIVAALENATAETAAAVPPGTQRDT